jgi:hypothetical protein
MRTPLAAADTTISSADCLTPQNTEPKSTIRA